MTEDGFALLYRRSIRAPELQRIRRSEGIVLVKHNALETPPLQLRPINVAYIRDKDVRQQQMAVPRDHGSRADDRLQVNPLPDRGLDVRPPHARENSPAPLLGPSVVRPSSQGRILLPFPILGLRPFAARLVPLGGGVGILQKGVVLALTQMLLPLLAAAARGGEEEEARLDEARPRLGGDGEATGSPPPGARMEGRALGEGGGVATRGEGDTEGGRWHLDEIYRLFLTPLLGLQVISFLDHHCLRELGEKESLLPKFSLGPVD